MLPPGEGWALFLLWVCAHIGGFTANKVNLPPLLGMLVAGIVLRNIPQGDNTPLNDADFAFVLGSTCQSWCLCMYMEDPRCVLGMGALDTYTKLAA